MSNEAIIPIALAVLMVVLTAVYVWLTHKILQKQSRKEELKEYDLYFYALRRLFANCKI